MEAKLMSLSKKGCLRCGGGDVWQQCNYNVLALILRTSFLHAYDKIMSTSKMRTGYVTNMYLFVRLATIVCFIVLIQLFNNKFSTA